jgi:serine/threonine-protein kinase
MPTKCPKCQSYNPGTATFCADCGTQLPSIEDKEVTETIEAPKEELTTGSTFANRYQIIEELGKGGMGRVYRVLDKELKEEVALKLIKPEIASEKKTLERFNNELRLSRKIIHKNVGRMYELMDHQGTRFITMEYVSGEDLRGLIRRIGQLPIGKSISIAKQICEGLAEAHRLGVVHRDLKSNNIMIDKEGNVRIMDFGIARSLETKRITGSGIMIGTPEYMSPEQVEGKEVDQRADIYSLGVILYEMVTGRVPFEGDTPFTIGMKHKGETPKKPKELNTQISDDLNHVILRCLEKEKEKRYQSSEEVRSELEIIEKGIPTTERIVPEKKPLTSKEITVTFGLKKLLIPTTVVIALIVIIVVILQFFPQKEVVPLELDRSSIAVLPFIDLSLQKDQEILCDGMTAEIITKLSGIQGWKVMNTASVMRFKNTKKDIKDIGQELDVSTILLGSIRKEADDLRVDVQLVNVSDRFQIWGNIYEQKLTRIFEIQSTIAEKVVRALKAELSPEEEERLRKKPTSNIEAYNSYLKGRWFWNKRTKEGFEEAISYFKETIEKDVNYAKAYVGLADSYRMLGVYGYFPEIEAYQISKSFVMKALEIDESLSEAHTALGAIKMDYEWDWEGVKKEYERAIQLNPNYGTAHQWFANYLSYIEGRHEEAVNEAKRARELDPLSPIINQNVGRRLYFARQYDEAIKEIKKALKIEPEFWPSHRVLGLSYLGKEMFPQAIEELEKAVDLSGGSLDPLMRLGYAYAITGNQDKTIQIINDLKNRSKDEHIPSIAYAMIYIGIDDKDLAIEFLEKAYKERSHELIKLKVHPFYDSLRSDPMFITLLKKMNLE